MEVTLKEAAKLVDRPYATIWTRVASGEIPARKSGGTWLVSLDELTYCIAALRIRRRRYQSVKRGK